MDSQRRELAVLGFWSEPVSRAEISTPLGVELAAYSSRWVTDRLNVKLPSSIEPVPFDPHLP